ncbi:MAG TPA: hypothetical protein VH105_11460 [Burkholderiales bacterium]|nr:hypothetical protein [Burkholderiales bacterium]
MIPFSPRHTHQPPAAPRSRRALHLAILIAVAVAALLALFAAGPAHGQAKPSAPAPKGPAPTVTMPGNIDCSKAENRKEPVCNKQADPGIARAPAQNPDPGIARTPPPTGDGAKAGPSHPGSDDAPPVGRNESADPGMVKPGPRPGG